jgi:actin-related protein 5
MTISRWEEEETERQCIFVTGGSSLISNLLPRLKSELTPLLPFRAPMKIVSSVNGGDPILEAWRGMAEWSRTAEAEAAAITKAEYEEKGMEWIKDHPWGNTAPFE